MGVPRIEQVTATTLETERVLAVEQDLGGALVMDAPAAGLAHAAEHALAQHAVHERPAFADAAGPCRRQASTDECFREPDRRVEPRERAERLPLVVVDVLPGHRGELEGDRVLGGAPLEELVDPLRPHLVEIAG
jgi:hypothetical protein